MRDRTPMNLREQLFFVSWLKVLRKWATGIFGALIGVALFYGALGLLFSLFVIGMTYLGDIVSWLGGAYVVIAIGYPFIRAVIRREIGPATLGVLPTEDLTERESRRGDLIDEVVTWAAFGLLAAIPLSGLYALIASSFR